MLVRLKKPLLLQDFLPLSRVFACFDSDVHMSSFANRNAVSLKSPFIGQSLPSWARLFKAWKQSLEEEQKSSVLSLQLQYVFMEFCSIMPKNVVCPNLKGSNIQKVRCTYIGWFTNIVHSMHAVKSLSFDICIGYRIIFFNSSDGAQDLSGRWLLYSKLSEPWCVKERVDPDESFNSQPLSPMACWDHVELLR